MCLHMKNAMKNLIKQSGEFDFCWPTGDGDDDIGYWPTDGGKKIKR